MLEQMTFENILNATFLPESADGVLRSDSPDGPMTARSGRDHVPVSVSVPPGSNADSPTIGTCGRCSQISSLSAALNLSLANRLKMRLNMVGSIEYTQTWKLKVTPSGRQYWAHTASERRTGDSGCIGEAVCHYPTSNASNVKWAHENVNLLLRRVESGHQQNLQDTVILTAWPKTPMAGDAEGGTMEIRPETTGKYKLRDYAMLSGWPTAQTMDAMEVCRESEERSVAANAGGCANLRERVMAAAWMTPKATDGKFATPRTSGRPMEKSTHLQTQTVAVTAWHTAKATDGSHGGPNQTGGALPPDACAAAWPTILSSECRQGYQDRTRGKKGAQESLSTIIQTAGWQTITVNDSKNNAAPSQWRRTSNGKTRQLALNCEVFQVFLPGPATGSSTVGTKKSEGYRLNPFFSGWLMGFPRAWTLAGLVAYRRLEASRSPRKKKAAPCC